MATIRQLPSGRWQVQIHLKGRKASETFLRHDHAREWATDTEAQIDRGHALSGRRARSAKTLSALIDMHIDDMKEVGKTVSFEAPVSSDISSIRSCFSCMISITAKVNRTLRFRMR